jgi:GAF domain-containing protein
MKEPIESTEIHNQLSQQATTLADLYHKVLKETIFTSRAQVRPVILKRTASAEVEAVLNFFENFDKAQARQRGIDLCRVGLGDEAILRLAQTTREFCLTHLPESLQFPALNTIESYHNAMLQSFIQTREAIVLEEQEQIRTALDKSLQHYRVQMDVAADIAKATTSILDLYKLVSTSVTLIQEKFNFYYVGLLLVDEERQWAVLQAGSGERGQELVEQNYKLEIGGESLISQCITDSQARTNLNRGTRASDTLLRSESRTELALPLITRDEVIGAMTIQDDRATPFSSQEVNVLQTTVNQLAIAIENARLFQSVADAQKAAEALLQETMALQQLSQALSGTLNFQEILDIFFQTCTKVLGFDLVIFSLVDQDRQRVKAIAGVGVSEAHLKRANHPLDSNDIMADIIRTGRTELITGWDDRYDNTNFEAENMTDWGLRIFTPITLRKENIGLVELGFSKNVDITIEDSRIRLLRAFIDQTALALDNAQRYEASQRAARRETLIKEITTKIRASTNVETILQTTVKEVGEAIHGKRAYVHLVSPKNGQE